MIAPVRIGFAHLQRRHHVLLDIEAAEHAGLLRQIADAEPRAAIHRQAGDVGAVQADRAGVRLHQADDHVERRGLAGAVRAEQSHRLAAPQLDRDIPNHRALLVGLAHAARGQPGAACNDPELRSARASARMSFISVAPGGELAALNCWLVASFGTTRPCTRSPVPASSREMPVFMLTSASDPLSWFFPRVMRTCPPAARCRCRAHRRRGRRSRCRSTVRTATLPNASTFCSLPDAASGSSRRPAVADRRRGCVGGGFCGVGDQRVGREPPPIVGHHHGVAARHRHVLLRPVFQGVARGQHIVRRGQLQRAPGHHQHRLVQIIDRAIALHLIRRREDPHVSFSLHPVDLVAARVRCVGRHRLCRLRRLRCHRSSADRMRSAGPPSP